VYYRRRRHAVQLGCLPAPNEGRRRESLGNGGPRPARLHAAAHLPAAAPLLVAGEVGAELEQVALAPGGRRPQRGWVSGSRHRAAAAAPGRRPRCRRAPRAARRPWRRRARRGARASRASPRTCRAPSASARPAASPSGSARARRRPGAAAGVARGVPTASLPIYRGPAACAPPYRMSAAGFRSPEEGQRARARRNRSGGRPGGVAGAGAFRVGLGSKVDQAMARGLA
jgi:hypothetical protein